jgi:hypothetical protein
MGRYKPSESAIRALHDQLAQAFRHAQGERTISSIERETGIGRGKLTTFAKTGTFKEMSPEELLALNSFLSGRLAEILHDLRGTRMVDLLADAAGVTFILGARVLHWADHVSRWDVRAMTAILRSIQHSSSNPPEFQVEDALHVGTDGIDPEKHVPDTTKERWFGLLDQYDGRAVVAVGSPRACLASEYMLCRMFGETPFHKARGPLPFEFLWTTGLYQSLPSAFARAAKVGQAGDPASGILGLRTDGTDYRIDDRTPTWNTYGVGVAQRRRSGQLWVVIAGATGTATSAVAEVLPQVRGALPPATGVEDSDPMWFVVEAKVKREGQRGGDNRMVTSMHTIVDATMWDRSKRRPSVPPKMVMRVPVGSTK